MVMPVILNYLKKEFHYETNALFMRPHSFARNEPGNYAKTEVSL